MLQRVKMIAVVTAFSLLIWMWAEAESVRITTVTTRLVFEAQGDDVAIRQIEPQSADTFRVRLEGTTAAIDEAERLLGRSLRLTPGVGGVPGQAGDHTLGTADLLRQNSELARTGVSVVFVEPSTVTVGVTKLAAVRLPVRADLSALGADGSAIADTIVPSEVTIHASSADVAKLEEGAFAVASLTPDDIAQLRDEGQQTVKVRVRPPAPLDKSDFTRIEPDTVRITLRLRKTIDRLQLPPVPVWITLPPTEGREWDVQVTEPLLRDVEVSGPTELIEQLKKRDLVAIAFVVLTTDDLQKGIDSKLAVFAPVSGTLLGTGAEAPGPTAESALLEQVAPLRFSAENRRVGLKIKRRNGTGPSSGAAPTLPPGDTETSGVLD
ncbi:MAG: hypothetical protein KF745_12845 [Phycisphaeraceae bacterium]|nr:hypothetical protein [Phycisphaeraceae bacterium]